MNAQAVASAKVPSPTPSAGTSLRAPAAPVGSRAAGTHARTSGPAVDSAGGTWDFARIAIHSGAPSGDLPPSVGAAVHAPGRALDAHTRAAFEARFGHDFSTVRVHTDAAAEQSARDLNANAYTAGSHIVFGAGRYAPTTASGLRLLSHELAHVVQQAGAPASARAGVAVPGDAHERHADLVSEAYMRGGDVPALLARGPRPARAGLQRDTPQGTPPRQAPPSAPAPPPFYDRDTPRLPPVDRGQSAANLRNLLNAKVRSGEIASYAVKGVAAGSHQEIFLLQAIVALAAKKRWGMEADIVTPIDWPAKPADPVPQGRVTVTFSGQGAAVAELLGAGPVPAPSQVAFADGTARLVTEFSFASVTGWNDDAKGVAEISDVIAALVLLKTRAPQDVAALKGVALMRVASLGSTTAGEFSIGGRDSTASATRTGPTLKLSDRAFMFDDVQFFGGGPGSPTLPASFQTILHEVGHAVEKQVLRAASEDLDKAEADLQTARQAVAGNPATYQAAFDEAKRKGKLQKFWKDQETAHRAAEAAEAQANTRARDAHTQVDNTLVDAATVRPFESDAAAAATTAANALATAKTAVQGLRADEIQSSAAWLQAIDATAAAIVKFAQDAKAGGTKLDDLEAILFRQGDQRTNARSQLRPQNGPQAHRALAPLDAAMNAQNAWSRAERAVARARLRTKRVQKFVDLVRTNRIAPFTRYAADNWPLKPEEFYAEAYSLWLVDANFLKTHYRVVFDFFENGDHRQ